MDKEKLLFSLFQSVGRQEICICSFKIYSNKGAEKQGKTGFEGDHQNFPRVTAGRTLLSNRNRSNTEIKISGTERDVDSGSARILSGLRKIPVALIKLYQQTLSPYLPRTCRFYPSCSNYAIEAFEKKGILRGLILTTWRVLRCNPLSRGGFDPVR